MSIMHPTETNQEPHIAYEEFPFYIPLFKCMMSIGSSVIIEYNTAEKDISPFFIEGIVSYKNVLVGIINKFQSASSTISVNLFQYASFQRSNQQISTINTGIASGIQELVQTFKVIQVDISSIVDIAFFFQLSDIEAGKAHCQGISNCFLVRYCFDNGKYTENLNFCTFPCQHALHQYFPSCFIWRIWSFISHIQDILWSALNRASEKQSKFGDSIRFKIDQEMVNYLVYKSTKLVEIQNVKVQSRIRATTLKGLHRRATRVQVKSSMLRYETESQLSLLRTIIGTSSSIGLQKKRPKLNIPDKIQFNDLFHLIIGNELNEEPTRLRTTKSGVDIIFNENYGILTVRYKKFIYNDYTIFNTSNHEKLIHNKFLQYMMNGDSDTITSRSTSQNNVNFSVEINSYLKRPNDGVLKVSHFVDNNQRAVLVYVFPKEKRGYEIFEDDFEKLKLEIEHYSH
jgi:hypothetical protein